MKKTAERMALADISQHMSDNGKQSHPMGDNWDVFPIRLSEKDQHYLNRELGINKVNYIGNTNGKIK